MVAIIFMKLINTAVAKCDSSDFGSCPCLHSVSPQLSSVTCVSLLRLCFFIQTVVFSEARSDNQGAETENDSHSLSGGFTPALLIQNRLGTEGEWYQKVGCAVLCIVAVTGLTSCHIQLSGFSRGQTNSHLTILRDTIANIYTHCVCVSGVFIHFSICLT